MRLFAVRSYMPTTVAQLLDSSPLPCDRRCIVSGIHGNAEDPQTPMLWRRLFSHIAMFVETFTAQRDQNRLGGPADLHVPSAHSEADL